MEGYSKGILQLGLCIRDGLGLEQNFGTAMKLFKLAADDGNKYGNILLGLCYLNGDELIRNEDFALHYFCTAAAMAGR